MRCRFGSPTGVFKNPILSWLFNKHHKTKLQGGKSHVNASVLMTPQDQSRAENRLGISFMHTILICMTKSPIKESKNYGLISNPESAQFQFHGDPYTKPVSSPYYMPMSMLPSKLTSDRRRSDKIQSEITVTYHGNIIILI
jgi:hypothetical protein